MKKVYSIQTLSILLLLFYNMGIKGQNASGTVYGHVLDSTTVSDARDNIVLAYNLTQNGYPDFSLTGYIAYTYTDSVPTSNYVLNFDANHGDSILIAVPDCNSNLNTAIVSADSNGSIDTIDFGIACQPHHCSAIMDSYIDSSGNYVVFEGLGKRNTVNASMPTHNVWTFSDNVNKPLGTPSVYHDTVMRNINTIAGDIEFCYVRLSQCGGMACDSFKLAGNTPACQNGNICGNVVNSSNGQPADGNAVFVYNITQNGYPDSSLTGFTDHLYADSAGEFTFSNLAANQGDSLLVGTVDCNYDLHWDYCVADSNQSCSVTLTMPCAATGCQAVIDAREDNTNTYAVFESVLLRDAASLSSIPTTEHLWDFSNNMSRTHGILISSNRDTVMVRLDSLPQNFEYCYTRFNACGAGICDSSDIGTGAGSPGNNLTCAANFFVDTVNSMNHQGQVVMWENSTTSSGSIIDYHWDFGDNTTYNSQYPTHTYNDTDIYNVCLTITAVDGADTCINTFCDSIGFDQNGNLVYKTEGEEGFTINVIDPETVGMENLSNVDPEFNLFPNPTNERAVLTWNPDYNIRNIEIIGISGKLVRNINAANQSGRVEFDNLNSGIYIVRIVGDEQVTPIKMIVK